ncbi:ERF family protein [Viridibacillus sp. NPDC096237]|uniref:ERF family protein n=1 Tax=Viridibacillus sp. NPDC096237 TaxID=3390721 RepID=UPI003CFD6F1E
MKKSESIAELAKALAGFQRDVKQPLKDKANPFFKSKYVPLENVVEAITESSAKHGLSFIQYPLNQENKVGIVTILMHQSGEWIESEPIFATPAKQDAQATGSVITYLKRYSLSAIFGITSDEDDDGNAGTHNKQHVDNYNQQNSYQKPPQQPMSDNITAPQIKALKAKLNNVASVNSQEIQLVYVSSLKHLKIDETKGSKDLTKGEASKLINYLASLETQAV